MFKILVILLALGATSTLAALDEEHTFVADFQNVRLRRNSLPVSYADTAVELNILEDLPDLAGDAFLREARRARKPHRRPKKSRRGHKKPKAARRKHQKKHRRPKKYEDASNEGDTGEAIPFKSHLSEEETDVDRTKSSEEGAPPPAPVSSEERDDADDSPPVALSEYSDNLKVNENPVMSSIAAPANEIDDADDPFGC